MDWIEVLYLTLLVLLTPFAIWECWHQHRCPFCRAARKAVKERHPDWRVWTESYRHRAEEENRVVIAVFYREPGIISFPEPYVLIAVARDLTATEELPEDPDSPYALRNRK